MAWVKTDDNAPLHPKFFRAGVAAYGFWHACLSYCNRWLTDGRVPGRDLATVFPGTPHDEVAALIEILVREGLLEVMADGYRMHDYHHFQPRKFAVLKLRRARAVAGRKGGVSTAKRFRQVAGASAGGLAGLPTRPDPTRPDPAEKKRKRPHGIALADDAFLAALKVIPAYRGLDIDAEVGKCQAWLLTPRGRGKQLTQQRVVNWLNRADKPIAAPARQNPGHFAGCTCDRCTAWRNGR